MVRNRSPNIFIFLVMVRNEITSVFLFLQMVQNRIPSIFILRRIRTQLRNSEYFALLRNGLEQNSKLFYLSRNGLEWNSERFLFDETAEFRRNESIFLSFPCSVDNFFLGKKIATLINMHCYFTITCLIVSRIFFCAVVYFSQFHLIYPCYINILLIHSKRAALLEIIHEICCAIILDIHSGRRGTTAETSRS